jgi:hypothetical protein
MHAERIDVIPYSGYRDDERPGSFFVHGEKIEVVEVLDRWIEEGLEDRARKRFFRLKGSDGNIHRIYYDEKALGWFSA